MDGLKNKALEDLPEDIQRTVGLKNKADVFINIDDEESDGRDRVARKRPGSKNVLKIEVCTK